MRIAIRFLYFFGFTGRNVYPRASVARDREAFVGQPLSVPARNHYILHPTRSVPPLRCSPYFIHIANISETYVSMSSSVLGLLYLFLYLLNFNICMQLTLFYKLRIQIVAVEISSLFPTVRTKNYDPDCTRYTVCTLHTVHCT